MLDTQIQIDMDSFGFASFLHVLVNNNTDQTILVSSHWLGVPGGQYVVTPTGRGGNSSFLQMFSVI